jgi:hypothetical protein
VVVNTSSMAGLVNSSAQGFGGGLSYTASKHAVTIVTEVRGERAESRAQRHSLHLQRTSRVDTQLTADPPPPFPSLCSTPPATGLSPGQALAHELRSQPGNRISVHGLFPAGVSTSFLANSAAAALADAQVQADLSSAPPACSAPTS